MPSQIQRVSPQSSGDRGMNKPVQASRDDLVQMAKMQFSLLSETMAELSRTSDDGHCSLRMSASVGDVSVSCITVAEKAGGGEE